MPVPELPADAAAGADRYVPPKYGEPAVIVDIDGTVALMDGRSPYDMTRVFEDKPNEPVIAVVRSLGLTALQVADGDF